MVVMGAPIAFNLEYLLQLIALTIESKLIIVYGAIVCAILLIKAEIKSPRQAGRSQREFLIEFTTRIMTALEFLIAADLIKTIIRPTFESLSVLANIVAIRVTLTFVLSRELHNSKQQSIDVRQGQQQDN